MHLPSTYRTLGAVLLLLGLVATACQQRPVPPALLPPGMGTAPVPPEEVNAYLYLNPGQPTRFPKGVADLPVDVEVASASFWLGHTEAGEFQGSVLDFASADTARLVYDNLPVKANQWKHLSGVRLTLVTGTPEATQGLRQSIAAGQWQQLSSRYPKVWNDLNLVLPADPPAPPRVAGFFQFKGWLDWAAEHTGNPDLKQASSLVSTAGLTAGVFATYSPSELVPPQEADLDLLKESPLSGLVVLRSSYPGFIFSFLLNNVASRLAPLKPTTLDGETALQLDVPGMDISALLKGRGNYLYLAAAGEEAAAQALLLSALSK